MNLDQLTEQIWQRLQEQRTRALLIGAPPQTKLPYELVEQEPYDAVVIGTLPPGELLRMPSDPVCVALLEAKPVWYDPNQPFRTMSAAGALRRKLAEAERQLLFLGVQPLPAEKHWITAQDAIRISKFDLQIPSGKMTPLAKEILEEQHIDRRNGNGKFLGDKKVRDLARTDLSGGHI